MMSAVVKITFGKGSITSMTATLYESGRAGALACPWTAGGRLSYIFIFRCVREEMVVYMNGQPVFTDGHKMISINFNKGSGGGQRRSIKNHEEGNGWRRLR